MKTSVKAILKWGGNQQIHPKLDIPYYHCCFCCYNGRYDVSTAIARDQLRVSFWPDTEPTNTNSSLFAPKFEDKHGLKINLE